MKNRSQRISIISTITGIVLLLVALPCAAFEGDWIGKLDNEALILLEIRQSTSDLRYDVVARWQIPTGQFRQEIWRGANHGGLFSAGTAVIDFNGDSVRMAFNPSEGTHLAANLIRLKNIDHDRPLEVDLAAHGWKPIAISGKDLRDEILTKSVERHPRDKTLQEAFSRFPLLQPKQDESGRPLFLMLDLSAHIVTLNGLRYTGFRFVADMDYGDDFYWAFLGPVNLVSWYILPETGEMKGFQNFDRSPRRSYAVLDPLEPIKGETVNLQRLPGAFLTKGEPYLIWFQLEDERPPVLSLAFAFAPASPSNTRISVINALHLNR